MALPADIETRLRELGVRPDDVEERFVRGSGPGGQKMNKTSSTVCLRHRPSGLEVRSQRERSQSINRELAWRELCGRLEARRRRALQLVQAAKETDRRRNRQKTPSQKFRMVEGKRRRARQKAFRGRIAGDDAGA